MVKTSYMARQNPRIMLVGLANKHGDLYGIDDHKWGDLQTYNL